MCFYGCKNTAKHNHEHETAAEHAAHTHEGHNHEHEEHDHDHEGHNHEQTGSEEGHSDEIIFTKEQAAKTEFEVQEIQPGSFRQVIKTTGPGTNSTWRRAGDSCNTKRNNHLCR